MNKYNLIKDKKIILFDVDGTIAESGEVISDSIKKLIKMVSKKYDIGILGGGKLDKILFQMKDLYFNHYFTECGSVYYINNSFDNILLENVYTLNIREHALYKQINILVKKALYFISQVDYIVSGSFIDLRNGMIYISLIGMDANIDERKMFIEKNKIFNYREKLLNILINEATILNIKNKITICEGGSVGLAIYPNENDKIQVLDHIKNKYNEIHYFGDKYTKNGNDYKIINDKSVIGYRVNSIDDTELFLLDLLGLVKS
jgi:phosphomannomutase